MPYLGKVALERREQARLGAALQHLAEERAVRGERLAREIGRGFSKRHDPEMIGRAMAGRVRRHVGEHDIGRPAEQGLDLVARTRIEKIAPDEVDTGDRCHLQTIGGDNSLPLPLRAADAPRRDLAPAAGRGAEIDHPRAGLEQMLLVVDLDELEGGAASENPRAWRAPRKGR